MNLQVLSASRCILAFLISFAFILFFNSYYDLNIATSSRLIAQNQNKQESRILNDSTAQILNNHKIAFDLIDYELYLKLTEFIKPKLSETQLQKVVNTLNPKIPLEKTFSGPINLVSLSRNNFDKLVSEHEVLFSKKGQRRKIYIDIGAHDGASIEYVVEGTLANENSTNEQENGFAARQGASEDLRGIARNESYHIYAVEPNHRLTSMLEEKRTKYLSNGLVRTFQLFTKTAITTKDGPTYVISDTPSLKDSSAGVTLMNNSRSAVGPMMHVDGIDIITFLKDIVQAKRRDFIILKIDVEGHEYDLVQRLITSGWIQYIDLLATEYHHENIWVFGNTDESREFYGRRYECLQWFLTKLNVNQTLWL